MPESWYMNTHSAKDQQAGHTTSWDMGEQGHGMHQHKQLEGWWDKWLIFPGPHHFLTTLACLLLNPETGLGSSHRFTHGIYVKMNTSTVINHQAKLLSPINKQLPCSSPAYYTRLLEIIFARGLQSFLNINSLLKVIHLGQWIFSQVSCSDQSVPSDLIICSSVNALMAPGYPDTAGQCWNDMPSRIMSSSGLLGNPCCCL